MITNTPYKIEPAAGKHAIVVMALAVEFATPLAEEDITRISETYESSPLLKEKLPVKAPVQQIQFEFKAGNPASNSVSSDAAVGFELQQPLESRQPAWSITVLRELITCKCTVYDRWSTVKPFAMSLLTPILTAVCNGGSREIKAIGLQYEDAFIITGDISKFRAAAVVRESNKWLPGEVFEHQSFWHVHQGWFSAGPENRRVLNILNVDLSEVAPKYRLRINGQHRMLSVDMGGAQLPLEISELERAFDHMHAENKRILINLLNDELRDSIGLTI